MLAGLLGKDRVVGVALLDRLDDQPLRGVVRIGHDIALALVVDRRDAPVGVEEDPAGLPGEVGGEGELIGPGGAHGRSDARPSSSSSVEPMPRGPLG